MLKRQERRRRSTPFGHVLVVRKVTALEEIMRTRDRRKIALLTAHHPSVRNIEAAHLEHVATVEAVMSTLKGKAGSIESITRTQLCDAAHKRWDLIVTIGGDGMLLDASHFLRDSVPVIAVNSAPSTSHGKYCVADGSSFAKVLLEIIAGERQPLSLMRLRLTLDGKLLKELVLNEVLIAHQEIGETSRYIVESGEHSEEHKSDGIFLGTPSGSTGWMRSYDGHVVPLDCRLLPFVTRGLIRRPGTQYSFARGLTFAFAGVKITSMMDGGVILIDGHNKYPFPHGSELVVRPTRSNLKLYIDATANDRYITAQPSDRVGARH